jgi:hypothetical protein
MGIGSLARYRRYILILGGVLFLGGAVLRWHSQRQLGALESSRTDSTGTAALTSWADDCRSYACRVIGLRGPECDATCDEAVVSGRPQVAAERIAHACRKYCVAEEPDDGSCPGQCLIREAMRSAAQRAR